MLLTQTFKTGGLSVGAGSSTITRRNALAVNLNAGRRVMSKPVSASSATGGDSSKPTPGRLESKMDKVTSFVGQKLHGDGKAASATEPTVEYTGTAIVVKKLYQFLDVVDRGADLKDDFSEIVRGKHVSIQLMSGTIDPSTGKGKLSSEVNFTGWVTLFDALTAEQIKFETKFTVPKSFGTPVAIVVRNTHPNEFLLESFKIDLPDKSVAHYITNSWVYNTEVTKPIGPRVFFHNKAYLPHETPEALKALREKELNELRGDGTGERVQSDRIYDYAPYNDLGKPDDAKKLKKTPEQLDRPPLGGNAEYPFPRRIRTGRARTKFNPLTESRIDGIGNFYVPSDERFDYRKESDNKADMLRAGGHAAKTKIGATMFGKTTFETLDEVKALYAPKGDKTSNQVLPGKSDPAAEAAAVRGGMRFIAELMAKRADGEEGRTFRFPIPQIIKESDNAWATDSEFARENLAGFNPIMIKRVTEFPIRSKLPASEYGNPESAITAKHIDGKLEGLSIEQALSEKKLYTVDHHDTFLPWVARINALPNSKTYASRVLFYLCKDDTLKVLAIELVLPPKEKGGDKITRVFTPPVDESKKDWLWVLAKAHAINNEMTIHQAVSHFTLCHAVTEPAILSAHRNLSKLHPIMQLVFPHFKHTIQVNSTARMNLLPTDGTIEEIYTPREYVVRMASVYYRDNWTFESNALPTDLINRGMAEADPNSKYGVKLAIEDYPYAADGLELWNAMKEWHREYINIFYEDDAAVKADPELAKWWEEYRNVGHGDMKDAQGWPALDGKESLNEILTTVIWICTAMHAPINFGQYDYAAWMPQHPAITRKLIPEQGSKDWDEFQKNPEKFWLSMISDTDTTCTAMAVFEVVAAHAPDEEYIGQRSEGWTASEQVQGAFDKYVQKLHAIDDNIVKRNSDKNLKNRCGVGNFPFQLLRPFSQPGVTAMGVPNSITV